MNTAFHNDANVRDLALKRLRTHVAAGRLVPGPLQWNGEQGSLVGCLVESDELIVWQAKLGLPQWLAVTLDALSANLHETAEMEQFGVDCLQAIRVGADVDATGSALVVHVLDVAAQATASVPAGVADSLAAVRALHVRAAARQAVAPAEWRAARKAATQVTDTLEEETPAHDLSACVESAAWDPQRASSSVNDVLRLWQNTCRAQATHDAGWTREIDTRIRTRLQEMFDVHMGGVQGDTITVFDMLAKYHPEDHDLVLGRNKIDSDVAVQLNARAKALLLSALGAA